MPDEVRLSGVTKVFRHPRTGLETVAVKNVDFHVRREEVVSVLGPSGCGKSTILNIIAGFESPTEGRALVEDKEIQSPGPDRGVVFQDLYLFDWLTIEENIAFALKMRGQRYSEYRERVEEYIALVGLAGFKGHRPPELSGGMRQRVALARVLINEPRILLMDEPFAALDAQTRLFMQMWLLDVLQRTHSTALFITHDIDEAILVADRVCVMSARPGRIIREFEVCVERPRTRDMLSSREFVEIKRECLELIAGEFGKSLHANTLKGKS
jgi:ABC-type nitrate/sulfonate/bicarbonate transport system ATPase subunit